MRRDVGRWMIGGCGLVLGLAPGPTAVTAQTTDRLAVTDQVYTVPR